MKFLTELNGLLEMHLGRGAFYTSVLGREGDRFLVIPISLPCSRRSQKCLECKDLLPEDWTPYQGLTF